MPPIKLLWIVAVDAIAISIVSYSVTISMGMILAKKQSYEVRANQEMMALVGGVSPLLENMYPFQQAVATVSFCRVSVT